MKSKKRIKHSFLINLSLHKQALNCSASFIKRTINSIDIPNRLPQNKIILCYPGQLNRVMHGAIKMSSDKNPVEYFNIFYKIALVFNFDIMRLKMESYYFY